MYKICDWIRSFIRWRWKTFRAWSKATRDISTEFYELPRDGEEYCWAPLKRCSRRAQVGLYILLWKFQTSQWPAAIYYNIYHIYYTPNSHRKVRARVPSMTQRFGGRKVPGPDLGRTKFVLRIISCFRNAALLIYMAVGIVIVKLSLTIHTERF